MIDEILKNKIINSNSKYKHLMNLILNKKIVKKNININKISSIKNYEIKTNFYTNKLKQMGLVDYEEKCRDLLKINKPHCVKYTMRIYAEKYINFLMIIDLTENKRSIIKFEPEVFIFIFKDSYIDDNIEYFIEKYVKDPLAYDQNEKKGITDLSILLYEYCYHNKFEKYLNLLKNKIFNHYNDSSKGLQLDYDYKICHELIIDNILLLSNIKKCLYQEAVFLNSIYNFYKDKSFFVSKFLEPFMKRIIENIKNIHSSHFFDFIKKVFLFDSILYSMIENTELLLIPFKFLEKNAKMKNNVYECFLNYIEILLDKTDIGIFNYEYLLNKHLLIKMTNIKSELLISVREMNSLSNFSDILQINRDSFFATQILINEYKKYFAFTYLLTDPQILLEILEINIKVYKIIKEDFLIQLDKIFIKIFKSIIERVSELFTGAFNINYIAVGSILLLKQGFFCEELSNFVIMLEKNSKPMNNKKKKLSAGVRDTSEISRFIESIHILEFNLNKYREKMHAKENITLLKNRSFQIITSNQTVL